ncbi:MAG: ATP-binding cassette domain-containing protein [Calditrichaeota bacterium]|nr:MAG: ATP-binding cassette domain-containing protein [Calditrichota bacterium]
MIEVKNLTRYYGEKCAINNVSFRVEKGEVLGLLGPNAAGKTTTMRILTCYMPPTSGDAWVAGYNIWEAPMEVKKRIGYLPENPPLYHDLRVEEYLNFVAKIKGVPGNRLKSQVSSAIERAGLTSVARQVIGSLSKGYKQRVGLAQALLNDPDVLILDEPTVGLDPRQIIEIRQLIKNLGGDHTVILSTHILPEVEMTCQRVVIINEGQVVAQDTPENLTRRLRGTERILLELDGDTRTVEEVLGRFPQITSREVEKLSGNGHVRYALEVTEDIRNQLARAVVESGVNLYELRSEAYSLEDIFLHLTTKEEEAVA